MAPRAAAKSGDATSSMTHDDMATCDGGAGAGGKACAACASSESSPAASAAAAPPADMSSFFKEMFKS